MIVKGFQSMHERDSRKIREKRIKIMFEVIMTEIFTSLKKKQLSRYRKHIGSQTR